MAGVDEVQTAPLPPREAEERAEPSDLPVLRPFIRWAGSKRLMLEQLLDHVPSHYGTYFEPFVGGGSLLLRLRPKSARVADALLPLTDAWKMTRDDVDGLIERVHGWRFDRVTYDAVKRETFADPLSRAAQFLYLNRGAYGGIWRVNSRGQFNVPWSEPKTDSPLDEVNLRAIGEYLSSSGVVIRCADFAELTAGASSGDLVFLDPPYSKGRPHRPFIHYNESLFDWDQQVRLAAEAERLRSMGASVIVTNSTHPDVAALYPEFRYVDVQRHNSLGATTEKGRQIAERIFVPR